MISCLIGGCDKVEVGAGASEDVGICLERRAALVGFCTIRGWIPSIASQ